MGIGVRLPACAGDTAGEQAYPESRKGGDDRDYDERDQEGKEHD